MEMPMTHRGLVVRVLVLLDEWCLFVLGIIGVEEVNIASEIIYCILQHLCHFWVSGCQLRHLYVLGREDDGLRR